MPRLAVKAVLDCVIGFESKSLYESLADERRAVHANARTADAKEGMMAFIEKRKPVFNQDA
jgi:enoyl-CoA hydratase/carnithine racemase